MPQQVINIENADPNNLKAPPQHAAFRLLPYSSAAIPEILKLTRATLGNDGAVRKTEAFWNWKHEENHFGPSYGLYAWSDREARAVALRVLMRWRFCNAAGENWRAVRAVDTATHQDYQRQGIFSKLTRQAIQDLQDDGVDLIYNTPNARSLPGYLKMGWQAVAKWPLYLRILRPIRMLSRYLKSKSTSPQALKFDDYFAPEIMPWQAFAERYRRDIPTLISNWEQQRRQTGWRTPRDFNYLQWRYGQHPHITYGVFALVHDGKLEGFAILRPNQRNGCQEIVLTELFLKQVDSSRGKILLKRLRQQLRGDYLVAHFAQNTVEKKLLGRAGFFKIPTQGLVFTVKPLSPQSRDALNATAWDLTLGDLEIF